MRGDSEEDTALLKGILSSANGYIRSFKWCKDVTEEYFGEGVGGIYAVFLFHIVPESEGVDDWLWVVSGDLPSAYLVTDNAATPSQALDVCCDLMQSWVDAVRNSTDLGDEFPVDVAPTQANADALERRVAFLRNQFARDSD